MVEEQSGGSGWKLGEDPLFGMSACKALTELESF